METVFVIAIVIYSIYRTWVNALYPFVFIIFINIVEFWIKVRVEFFYSYSNILDYFTILLFGFAVVRHCRSIFKDGLVYYRVEIGILLLILYSWISMTWSIGVYWDLNPGLIYKTVVNQVLMFLCVPLLFKVSFDRYDFEKDFILTGLIVVPVIAFTTNWAKRGQEFLFAVADPTTGGYVEKASNALQLSYFAGVVILFNVFYLRNKAISIISFIVGVPVSFYLLIESQTRGQMLAIMLSTIVFLPFAFQRFRTVHYFTAAPLVLLVIAFVAPNFGEIVTYTIEQLGFDSYYSSRFESDRMALDYGKRIRRATDALTVWQSSWSGMLVGLGTASATSEKVSGDYIHIISLEVLIEQGLIGMTLYLYILFGIFSSIYMMLDIKNLGQSDRSLALFLSSVFMMSFIISFKQGALYNSHEFVMSGLLVFVISKHLRRKYKHTPYVPTHTQTLRGQSGIRETDSGLIRDGSPMKT